MCVCVCVGDWSQVEKEKSRLLTDREFTYLQPELSRLSVGQSQCHGWRIMASAEVPQLLLYKRRFIDASAAIQSRLVHALFGAQVAACARHLEL